MANGQLEGEITEIDRTKGIGIITTPAGDRTEVRVEGDKEGKNQLFFKSVDLAPGTTIDELRVGTRVMLIVTLGENGPRATNVSKADEAE